MSDRPNTYEVSIDELLNYDFLSEINKDAPQLNEAQSYELVAVQVLREFEATFPSVLEDSEIDQNGSYGTLELNGYEMEEIDSSVASSSPDLDNGSYYSESSEAQRPPLQVTTETSITEIIATIDNYINSGCNEEAFEAEAVSFEGSPSGRLQTPRKSGRKFFLDTIEPKLRDRILELIRKLVEGHDPAAHHRRRDSTVRIGPKSITMRAIMDRLRSEVPELFQQWPNLTETSVRHIFQAPNKGYASAKRYQGCVDAKRARTENNLVEPHAYVHHGLVEVAFIITRENLLALPSDLHMSMQQCSPLPRARRTIRYI